MDNIDKILELYFEGKTSLEQERKLKEYFSSAGVSPQHKMYRPLFDVFEQEKTIVFAGEATTEKKRIRKQQSGWKYIASSIAAVMLTLIGIFSIKSSATDYLIVNGKRINNSELAQEMAQEKLMHVSVLIEKNLSPIRQLNKIETCLQPIENVNKQLRHAKEKINNINLNL
jgi:hypothetical protein